MKISVGVGVLALIVAIAAAPLPANAQQSAAYTNPLDAQSDVSSWYFYDYLDYWAVDNTPIVGHDGNASLNNNDGSQIDPYYNYMYFESSPIDIDGFDTPTVTWWCLADVPDPGNNYVDRAMYLYDGNWNWGFYYSMGDSGYDLNCGSAGEWHQHSLPIPQEIQDAGSLIFSGYIYYEIYDGSSGQQGWFLDTLLIIVPDITPPDAVSDLNASNATLTEIQVDWSAPADDDISGVTASYDLRMSTSAITGTNFSAATPITGEPTPDVEGTLHTLLVTGLTEDTTYFFAVQTTDIAGNVSAVSNVAILATLTPPPPPPPPAPAGPAGPELPPDDILPCSAGTTAAPTGLLGLAGVVLLAFTLRRKA